MKLFAIETGRFKLDGGAMFGVVPRTIWERTNPPDAQNRIEMAMRCLLIESGDKLILVDTGIGTKIDDRFRGLYNLDDHTHNLDLSLQQAGFSRGDVTDVILTHLHFDHCGGATAWNHTTNRSEVAFHEAKVWLHPKHLDWALNPNPREKASFFDDNIRPLQEASRMLPLDESTNGPIPEMDFFVSYGHTEGMLCPIISYKGRKIMFAADFIPTAGHLPLPYVMSYDVRPLVSMEERAAIFPKLVAEKTIVFFEHDAVNECGTVMVDERGKYKLAESFTLADIS